MRIVTLFCCVLGLLVSSCQGMDGSGETVLLAKDENGVPENSDQGSVTISKVEGKKSDDPTAEFDQSAFSKFVFFHKDGHKILINYNFFPEGSDFDSQKKIVHIPCDFVLPEDERLSVSISATEAQTPCVGELDLELSQAVFTLGGLVLSFDENFSALEKDFGVRLTREGAEEAVSGELIPLPFAEFTLENVASEVLELRQR